MNMTIRKGLMLVAAMLLHMPLMADSEGKLVPTWNAQNVILPASQVTPNTTWTAQAMVFSAGRRYTDSDYNHVWGTPPAMLTAASGMSPTIG